MIVCFVDIGGISDHHCLEAIVCFVDIGGIVVQYCLYFIFIILAYLYSIQYNLLCSMCYAFISA